MKTPHIRKLALGLILVTILLACKATSPKSEPPVIPTVPVITQPVIPTLPDIPTVAPLEKPEPTATSPMATPTAAPTEASVKAFPTPPPAQPGPETLDLTGLPQDPTISDFTESYDSQMTWQDPQSADQQASTLYSYRKQTVPADAWYANLDDNNPFVTSKIETTVIGQDFYTLSAEMGCLKPGPDRTPSYDPQDSFRSLIQALTGQVKLAQAEIQLGDQVTDLYTLQVENLQPDAQIVIHADQADAQGENSLGSSVTFPLLSNGGKLEEAKLYLARQGGYVARIELTFSQVATEQEAPFAKPGSKMTNTLVYEVIPSSAQDAPISLPAGCASLAGDNGGNTGGNNGGSGGSDSTTATIADVPRLEDASDVVEYSDSLIYYSNSPLQDAVDFYKTQLVDQGWEVSDETVMSGLASLDFTRSDQTLSLQIIDNNGQLMISITLS
jgi:hypothetical protein